jgi:hypothetical protein
MAKSKKRVKNTTKNTQKKKQIRISVAKTLDEALHHAERNGMIQVGYEGLLYHRIGPNKWEMTDIIPDLLQFPQYKKLYDEYRIKPDCGDLMAKDLLLAVVISNLTSGNEYDLSYLVR